MKLPLSILHSMHSEAKSAALHDEEIPAHGQDIVDVVEIVGANAPVDVKEAARDAYDLSNTSVNWYQVCPAAIVSETRREPPSSYI